MREDIFLRRTGCSRKCWLWCRDGDKGHRTRIIELRQFGDELMRKFLDGIEEAKPQIFFGHVDQKVANQKLVIRSDRPYKYPRAIPENKMPLPF